MNSASSLQLESMRNRERASVAQRAGRLLHAENSRSDHYRLAAFSPSREAAEPIARTNRYVYREKCAIFSVRYWHDAKFSGRQPTFGSSSDARDAVFERSIDKLPYLFERPAQTFRRVGEKVPVKLCCLAELSTRMMSVGALTWCLRVDARSAVFADAPIASAALGRSG